MTCNGSLGSPWLMSVGVGMVLPRARYDATVSRSWPIVNVMRCNPTRANNTISPRGVGTFGAAIMEVVNPFGCCECEFGVFRSSPPPPTHDAIHRGGGVGGESHDRALLCQLGGIGIVKAHMQQSGPGFGQCLSSVIQLTDRSIQTSLDKVEGLVGSQGSVIVYVEVSISVADHE